MVYHPITYIGYYTKVGLTQVEYDKNNHTRTVRKFNLNGKQIFKVETLLTKSRKGT